MKAGEGPSGVVKGNVDTLALDVALEPFTESKPIALGAARLTADHVRYS